MTCKECAAHKKERLEREEKAKRRTENYFFAMLAAAFTFYPLFIAAMPTDFFSKTIIALACGLFIAAMMCSVREVKEGKTS